MANIEKTITIDLLSQGVVPEIDIMQGDAFTRSIEILLYEGANRFYPFDFGFDNFSLAFVKPDGKKGWYDELPDGTPAVEESSPFILTAKIAPEATQVAGKVKAAVIMRKGLENQVATFPFILNVIENPAFDSSISNSYYAVKNLEELNATLEDTVRIKEQNFTDEQKIVARANIGAASVNALHDAVEKIKEIQESAVTVQKQTFTDAQKEQARNNLGAMKHGNVTLVSSDGEEIEVAGESSIKDDTGYTIAGRVGFYATDNDQKVILTHIHDGIDDTDAATVGQVKAVGDTAVKKNTEATVSSIKILHNPDTKDAINVIGSVIKDKDDLSVNSLSFLGDSDGEQIDTNSVILRGIHNGEDPYDAVNKAQLDETVGNIETALDSILAIQESLIGGGTV